MVNVLNRVEIADHDIEAPTSPALGEQNLRPNYRPDIDGLRAVAILSVVIYHLVPQQLPGGFLGVDIFFVISGFLISTIIFKSLARNGFSFAEFYAHRVRRIFPGLILVIAFCLLVGWHAMLPAEFKLLAKHVIASVGFAENFRLQQEAGYFDVATSLKPLMHLWSLAIEEQFYLIFPLLMWGVWRLRLPLFVLVAVIFAASLGSYLSAATGNPIAAFFFPQYRFWELMAGALLAYLMLNSERPSNPRALSPDGRSLSATASEKFGAWIAIAGLGFIGSAVAGVFSHFPLAVAANEIAAVAGSTLMILAGPSNCVNRLVLANRPAVFIGLISYPLYLWHWPLLSFLTIVNGDFAPFHQRAIAVAMSFVLATLTYRLVELPIRRNRSFHRKATFLLVSGSASLLILGVIGRFVTPQYDEATTKVIEAWNFAPYPSPSLAYLDKDYQLPALGDDTSNKTILIGDSHAFQYWQTVGEFAEKHKEKLDEMNETLLVATFFSSDNPGDLANLFKKIINDENVKTVIFSKFWALERLSPKINYAVRCCGSGLMQMIGIQQHAQMSGEQRTKLNQDFTDLVNSLKHAGKNVYLVLDNPFGDELAPRGLLARSFFQPIRVAVTPLPTKVMLERDEPARSSVIEIARQTGAQLIDPITHLCDQNVCSALTDKGAPVYRDYDHLSPYELTHHVHYLDSLLGKSDRE